MGLAPKPSELTDSQHGVGGKSPDVTCGEDVNPRFRQCEKHILRHGCMFIFRNIFTELEMWICRPWRLK